MREPTYVTALIHAAHHMGWHRLALLSVPLPVLSDWCADRGWDRMAGWLLHGMPFNPPESLANYIRWFCENEVRFNTAVMLGEPKESVA